MEAEDEEDGDEEEEDRKREVSKEVAEKEDPMSPTLLYERRKSNLQRKIGRG